MLKAFENHIRTSFPFLKGKKVLIAISGGLDSVVLTHLLYNLNFNISLAHCNFKLRGKDADDDEVFVKNLAKELGIVYYTKSFDTESFAKNEKQSIQMAARELRYTWFDDLMNKNEGDFILTAHHLNDQLETFLINFSRGTGLDGLTGIPEVNSKIVRPLLPFKREEIKHYANQNNLRWREDLSNAETKYVRNKIRRELIPKLEEINPDLLTSFGGTLHHLNQSKQLVKDAVLAVRDEIIQTDVNGVERISIPKIKELSSPMTYLYELLKEYGFSEWNDVYALLDAQSGKQIFSKKYRLIKDRASLLLSEISDGNNNSSIWIENIKDHFTVNSLTLRFKERRDKDNPNLKQKNKVFLDADKLKFPLELRRYKEGDYFYPIGMNGKKKLSKYFKDEKYSLLDKENSWVMCSEGAIVWLIDKRIDDRFKITENTIRFVEIEYLLG